MKTSWKWLAAGVAVMGICVFNGCTNGTGGKEKDGQITDAEKKTEHPSKSEASQEKPKDHPAH